MDDRLQRSKQLADFVRQLRDRFKIYDEIGGNYRHIGATIADAILQANRHYEKIVRPRVKAIRVKYASYAMTSGLNELLGSIAIEDFMDYKSKDRADKFRAVLCLFKKENIETCDELRCWLAIPQNRKKLLAIKGIGPKTADYFKILVGLQDAAVDRHLKGFLAEAKISYRNYDDAKEIINECADLLRVERAKFDHSIWQYQRQNKSIETDPLCFDSQ